MWTEREQTTRFPWLLAAHSYMTRWGDSEKEGRASTWTETTDEEDKNKTEPDSLHCTHTFSVFNQIEEDENVICR